MTIRIKDNGEPLVDVKKYCPGIVVVIDPKRMRREKKAYLRLGAAKMLGKARQYLPPGINFIIRDAWRPAYVQAKIYYWFIDKFSRRYPKWPRKRVIREVEKYVAWWNGDIISGHITGGAVDARLIDRHGRRIPMISKKLSYQENALSDQKKLPAYIRKNREILFSAMRRAGFSNCPAEYWHWSYGDYYWAKRNKKSATIYGSVADVNHIYEKERCPCNSEEDFKNCCGK